MPWEKLCSQRAALPTPTKAARTPPLQRAIAVTRTNSVRKDRGHIKQKMFGQFWQVFVSFEQLSIDCCQCSTPEKRDVDCYRPPGSQRTALLYGRTLPATVPIPPPFTDKAARARPLQTAIAVTRTNSVRKDRGHLKQNTDTTSADRQIGSLGGTRQRQSVTNSL